MENIHTQIHFDSRTLLLSKVTIYTDLGLGLYVDKNDGWKVKATTDQNKWNAFKIGDFHPQYPPNTTMHTLKMVHREASSVCTYDLLC